MFMGEKMHCLLCGKEQVSDPRVESNWRAIRVMGVYYYACVDEFPPDHSESKAFADVYEVFIEKALLSRLQSICQQLEASGGASHTSPLPGVFGQKLLDDVVKYSARRGWHLVDGWQAALENKQNEVNNER